MTKCSKGLHMSQYPDTAQKAAKSNYSAPSVRILGDVAKLTANGSKTGQENNGNVQGRG
jgi:hypothetical protein